MSTDDTIGGSTAAGMAALFQEGLNNTLQAENQKIMLDMARKANQHVDNAQGFFAEHWHAGTFNVDAYKKGLDHLFKAEVLASTERGSPDVRLSGANTFIDYQMKFYKTAKDTAAQLWNPEYNAQIKVVPSDQTAGVIQRASQKAVAEASSRPHVSEAAQHTATHTTDRVAHAGIESKPLSREQSGEFTVRARAGEEPITMADSLTNQEIANRMATGGAVAAGIGFATAATPHVFAAVDAWRKGAGITDAEFTAHLSEGLKAGSKQAFWSGLQGAVSTGLVHAAATGALGEGLLQLGPGPIGAMAVVAVRGIQDGMAWHRGEIDASEFAGRTVRTSVVASAGVAGAVVGQTLIPIPILGALIGSVIGSAIAQLGVGAFSALAEVVLGHLRSNFDAIAYILGDFDALASAQDDRIEAALGLAVAEVRSTRAMAFEAFRDLKLKSINLAAVKAEGERRMSTLEDFERRDLEGG